MDTATLDKMAQKYYPLLNHIVQQNKHFYCFSGDVHIRLFFNENPAVVAIYNHATRVIDVNIWAVEVAYQLEKKPLFIEWYLLHEIRHMYQRFCMDLLLNDPTRCPDINFAIRCKDNFEHYIKPEDAEGNINSQYYHQFVEFDAFVFSYSVMCLKYGELEYLSASLPKAFGEDFYHAVELCKQALNTCI